MTRFFVFAAVIIGAVRLLGTAIPQSSPTWVDNPCPVAGPCFPTLPQDHGGIRYIPDPHRILIANARSR
jgi:hypothetical protein